jgi:hypothetical protein
MHWIRAPNISDRVDGLLPDAAASAVGEDQKGVDDLDLRDVIHKDEIFDDSPQVGQASEHLVLKPISGEVGHMLVVFTTLGEPIPWAWREDNLVDIRGQLKEGKTDLQEPDKTVCFLAAP